MTTYPILFFADRLPPLIGGMEMHAQAFLDHFLGHARFPVHAVITRDASGRDCILDGDARTPTALPSLRDQLDVLPSIVFFNSGRWIEDLHLLRSAFPRALFVYRTGGNEIVKAPLERVVLEDHIERQAFWVRTLNATIDVLITNSAFTDRRLTALGILEAKLTRVVGGVHRSGAPSTKPSARPTNEPPRFFCASRFVPYKNHETLLEVFGHIASRGAPFSLRLAGDGPLFRTAQQQIARLGLEDRVHLLGPLSNEEVGRELTEADYYIQLSAERVTEVPGGSYVHAEGMGRSILEAIAQGKFVIAARTGALPEIITPERGSLVDLGSPKQIAAQVLALLASPPPRPPPVDEYSWGRCFELYEQIWEGTRALAPCH